MREHTVDDRLRWERRARALLSRLATISGTTQRTGDALSREPNLPRARLAADLAVRGAFGFPAVAGVILSSGEHLLSLINDVLSIAQIEAGHVVVSEADFDLARPVGGLRELFVPRARTKQLTMMADTDDLPRVRGDEAKLRQVLINLVGNAISLSRPRWR